MIVFILNCGSSSVKFQIYKMPGCEVLVKGSVANIGHSNSEFKLEFKDSRSLIQSYPIKDHQSSIELILETLNTSEKILGFSLKDIEAIGHRVVQGGEKHNISVLITSDVIDYIEEIKDLAPLHNPHHLSGIYACQKLLPRIPQVACFDNGFHMTLPRSAYLYGLPLELSEKHQIRRYGFHGIAFRSMLSQLKNFIKEPYQNLRIINMMLGSGTTANAVYQGKSIDVSTGFTPQEGLIQSTRAGDMDTAALLYLMKKEDLTITETDQLINKKSGWAGLSGIGNDMKKIHEAAINGNKQAKDTIDTVCHRFKKYIGAYAAEMGGLDVLLFSGGVGENAWYIREQTCNNLEFIGIKLDIQKNQDLKKEGFISTDNSTVKVIVVNVDEEKIIAQDTYDILSKNYNL